MSDDRKFPVKANSGIVAGIISKVGAVKTVGSKGHQKVEIVVTTEGRWPQHIPVEFFGQNLAKFETSGANVNDEVMIAVDIKGRESGSRVFGSNDGWHIAITRKGTPPPPAPEADGAGGALDDLPF